MTWSRKPAEGHEDNAMTVDDPAYANPAVPVEERVADLLGRMTVREKVGQVNQRLLGWRCYRRDGDTFAPTEALLAQAERFGGIGAIYGLHRADAWSGVHWGNGIAPERAAQVSAEIQRAVVERSRFGIPALLVEEAPHGHQALGASVLPTNIGLASGFDPDLASAWAERVAGEVRARGAHVALVSGLDLLRDPRWGRAEECFGEDPFLAAELAAATVRGMQGSQWRIAPDRVAVVIKHLAGQGAALGGRNAASAPIGPRELREIHLPPARAALAAGAAGVMAAYNDLDGVPCCANRWLLTELLRERWGFDGVVMADMGAIDRLIPAAGGREQAAGLALHAGVDLSLIDTAYTMIERAIEDGLASEADLDRACRRVLRLKIRLGLLDGPPTGVPDREAIAVGPWPAGGPSSTRTLVLLRNNGLLPLRRDVQRIAVIGPNADDVACQLGDYVAPLRPGTGTSLVEGLRHRFGEVRVARGSGLRGPVPGGLDEAATLAGWADVVVLALGGSSARSYDDSFADNGALQESGTPPEATAGEGVDVAEVLLDPHQLAVVERVRTVCASVVAIIVAGRPHGIGPVLNACDAVIYAWYPGPDGGAAVARALTGEEEPTGRLPVSLPSRSGVLPVAYDDRGEPGGYLDEQERGEPFGAGLGYTTWALGEVVVTGSLRHAADRATVRVPIRNTGARRGRQVVQLYGRFLTAGMTPRRAVLLGFDAVELEADGTRLVEFTIDRDSRIFAGYDDAPPGRLLVAAGLSSAVEFDHAVGIPVGPADARVT